jgi:uncharacterized protein YkwD
MDAAQKIRIGAAVAALAMVALGAPSHADDAQAVEPAPTVAPAAYVPTGTWQLLAEVNTTRRQHGLRPLVVDRRLAATARAWAEHLAASGTLAHNDPLFSAASHRRLGIRRLGENVGFDVSVPAQHRAFLASPHHRDNVLLPSYRVAGFAVVRDKDGHLWSTEDFGTPAT